MRYRTSSDKVLRSFSSSKIAFLQRGISMFYRIGAISRLLAAVALLALVTALFTFAPAAEAQSVTWKKLSAKNSPSARAYSAMAYDPVSKKIVLFSGFNGTTYPQETWTFDGTTWSKQKTTVAPSGRAGASMALDRVTRKLVLFGGFDGTHYLGDTWLWDGATSSWKQAHPNSSPTAVTRPMLFTDPKNGHDRPFWRFTMAGSTNLQRGAGTAAPGYSCIRPTRPERARSPWLRSTARERMLSSLADWAT